MSFAVPAVQQQVQQQGTPRVQLHLQVAAVELQLQCWPNNACFFLMFLSNLLTLPSLLLLLCPQAMLFAALLLCAFVATGAARTGTPRKLAQITVAGPGDANYTGHHPSVLPQLAMSAVVLQALCLPAAEAAVVKLSAK